MVLLVGVLDDDALGWTLVVSGGVATLRGTKHVLITCMRTLNNSITVQGSNEIEIKFVKDGKDLLERSVESLKCLHCLD